MEVPDIINYLESQYHTKLQDGSIKKELPDTNGDEKPKDIKVGQIGDTLASLCVERFRRFEDTLMVFNGKRYEMVHPEAMRRVIYGWLMRVGVGPAYLARSVDSLMKMLLRLSLIHI